MENKNKKQDKEKEQGKSSPFARETQTHEKILSHLKDNPRGLSTQEIEQQTGISRKAVEKHLQMLLFENEIYKKEFGSTRVYYPNHRFQYLDFRYFDFGKKRYYFDLIENNYGKALLVQQKIKENNKWISKGSIFIPISAAEQFAKAVNNLSKSKKLKQELKKE